MPLREPEGISDPFGSGEELNPPITPIDGEFSLAPTNDALPDTFNYSSQETASRLGNSRFINILRAAGVDFRDSNEKARALGSGLAVLAVQAVGATRLPSVLVPPITVEMLQRTGSPLEAGLTTAALFGAWSLTIGQTLKNGMRHYPSVLRTVNDNFSSLIKHFSKSLPGLDPEHKKDDTERRLTIARNVGNVAVTHARRGFTAFAIGISPYIAVAGIQNKSRSMINKLNLRLGLDAGLVVGLMSGGVAETIYKIGKHNPALARQIQDDVGNTKIWYGVAGGLMAAEWLKNRHKEKQLSKEV